MQYDLTRPNTGRTIDYWLGGSHNFEIDRQFADQVAAKFPVVVETVRVARSLVKQGVQHMYAHGIRALLDFGAGLPTCENTHEIARALDQTIKVVYSDIDPVTTAYGQELLRGVPNVLYLQCDAASPQTVLNAPQVLDLLGDERRVGIIYLALAHSMRDEQVRTSWRALYDWAAPGSLMFVSSVNERWKTDADLIPIAQMYDRADIPGSYRTVDELVQLAAPWQVTPGGISYFSQRSILPTLPTSERAIGYAVMFSK